MLRVGIETSGLLNPLAVSIMTFNAKGITSAHVSAARLYFTGDNPIFNTNELLATLTAPANDQ